MSNIFSSDYINGLITKFSKIEVCLIAKLFCIRNRRHKSNAYVRCRRDIDAFKRYWVPMAGCNPMKLMRQMPISYTIMKSIFTSANRAKLQ
ncbi:hypothetical protein P717_17530 [Enterobacter kobei]|nr:hypothetical protein P717_17530 [Enterobacter kobei]